MPPLISVAMAVFNGEKYLEEQVRSILSQTVENIELVMSDDCSTDGSWALMQRLAATDKRIRLHRNDHNLGFKKNFEKAISLCRGDYVALSDCDDIWMPHHLQLLLDNIGNKALACANSSFIDQQGHDLHSTLRWQESLDYIPQDDMSKCRSIILFRNPFQGATMLLPRRFVEKALPIPNQMRYHDTWFASLACFCGGIEYVDEIIMKYRRLPSSLTGMRTKRKSKLYRFLHVRFDEDRLDILRCIGQRCEGGLSQKQKRMISELTRILTLYNHNHRAPRLYAYLLRHYRSVFSCNLAHWI